MVLINPDPYLPTYSVLLPLGLDIRYLLRPPSSLDDIPIRVTLENTLTHKQLELLPSQIHLLDMYLGFDVGSTDIPEGVYKYIIRYNSHPDFPVIGTGLLQVAYPYTILMNWQRL